MQENEACQKKIEKAFGFIAKVVKQVSIFKFIKADYAF